MPQLSLSISQIKYIEAHRLEESGAAMARKFGVSKSVVGVYMRKHGLTVPKSVIGKFKAEVLRNRTTSDAKTDKFIKENYLQMPVKYMAAKINRSNCFTRKRMQQLNLIVSAEIIEQRKKDSQFKKGQESHTKGKKMSPETYEKVKKTMFQKGHITHNAYPENGVIVIRNDNKGRQYKYIRISLGKWQLLHQYNYENKYGKIPPGHCLWFKDGNSLNCEEENIELITRSENAHRNRQKFLQLPEELKMTIKIVSKIKRKIRKNEHKKQTIRP